MYGGIIGKDIVRYDIYGKDVAIANKMESTGLEGCVAVSEITKLWLERFFEKNSNSQKFKFRFHK